MTKEIEAYEHILCWIDGSDETCRMARRATLLEKALGAKLSFLATGTRPSPSDRLNEYSRIEGITFPLPVYLENKTQSCMDQAIVHAQKSGVTNTNRLSRSGNALAAICDIARMEVADLVMIGKPRSKFPLAHLFAPSLPNSLDKRCGLTVLSGA